MLIDLGKPAVTLISPAWIEGRAVRRLMVILTAPGCAYARRTGGCTNCGFHNQTTKGATVPAEQLKAQFQWALSNHAAQLPEVEHLDLYCSGSFFCEEEIPAVARGLLLELAASVPSFKRVLVESRPSYITVRALQEARRHLGDLIQLEVGIGLESINDEIRLRRIRKGFSLKSFERAAEIIAEAGVELVVYLLLKPIDTHEDAAIEDTVASGRYLHQLGQRLGLPLRIALEPAFVPFNTPLHQALLEGRYAPPSLWSVVKVVKELAPLLSIHVGLSTEGLPIENLPHGCDQCTVTIREALEQFNRTQELRLLAELSCKCQN